MLDPATPRTPGQPGPAIARGSRRRDDTSEDRPLIRRIGRHRYPRQDAGTCAARVRASTVAAVTCDVALTVVLKRSGTASTAIRTPAPSAGIPIPTRTGAMRKSEPLGMG